MATFEDQNGDKWTIRLDAPTIQDVRNDHKISLTDLSKDPMAELRADPEKLVNVIELICQDQIQAKSLDARGFARILPQPPDAMVEALQEAIIGFFPSGRASHVREVLTGYAEMAGKTDELALAKMKSVAENPETMKAIDKKADREIAKLMKELLGD